MGLDRYGEQYEKRLDPRGRSYYWATNEPPAPLGGKETDVTALRQGSITLTPLHFDLTQHGAVERLAAREFRL